MSRRGIAAAAVAAVSALVLAGCVSSGTVTDKSYSEPYRTCVPKRAPVCEMQPECWRLHLRSNRGDLGEVCVPREVWESHPVGSYYEGGGSS